MREVHCPHCSATNRRPNAVCQREISEPAAIVLGWKLYEQRRYVGIAFVASLLLLVLWRPWEFSPANQAECREQAARTARSNDAMRVLLGVCYDKFRQ